MDRIFDRSNEVFVVEHAREIDERDRAFELSGTQISAFAATRPSSCHSAPAAEAQITGSIVAHKSAARQRCCNEAATSVSRYTLGSTRSQSPAFTRRVIVASDTQFRAWPVVIRPSCRRIRTRIPLSVCTGFHS